MRLFFGLLFEGCFQRLHYDTNNLITQIDSSRYKKMTKINQQQHRHQYYILTLLLKLIFSYFQLLLIIVFTLQIYMTNNEGNFIFDINTDIKIQSGLKILEFATEYNVKKAFYGNCPFNNYLDHKKGLGDMNKNKYMEKQKEIGVIMSEMNEQIFNLVYKKESIIKKKASEVREQPFKFNIIKEEVLTKKKERASSKIQYVETDKKMTLAVMNKSESDFVDEDQLNSYVSSYRKQQSHKKPINYSPRYSNKSKNSVHQITLKDFTRKDEILMQSPRNNAESIIKSHAKMSNSIKSETMRSKMDQKLKLSKHQSKKQKLDSLSSKEYLELNRTYSNILPNSTNKHFNHQSLSQDNVTEFQLLKELSDSFVDEDNIKKLLKLQNFELQEKYLEHRMNKRIQKGFFDLQKIREVTWQSLRLPSINYQMKTFNIAHVID